MPSENFCPKATAPRPCFNSHAQSQTDLRRENGLKQANKQAAPDATLNPKQRFARIVFSALWLFCCNKPRRAQKRGRRQNEANPSLVLFQTRRASPTNRSGALRPASAAASLLHSSAPTPLRLRSGSAPAPLRLRSGSAPAPLRLRSAQL